MTEDNRRPLGIQLVKLERSYRVRAEATNGDIHLIVTSDRERAIKYLNLFTLSTSYNGASIELGNQSYDYQNLEQMP